MSEKTLIELKGQFEQMKEVYHRLSQTDVRLYNAVKVRLNEIQEEDT